MGEIITFYSFKGGVGRSMALANIAVLLARKKFKVLMIDWDLEAPGLDRYFHEEISDLKKTEGLIGFFHKMMLSGFMPDYSKYLLNIDGYENLSILRSGLDDFNNVEYNKKLTSLDWNIFYETKDGGEIIENFRNKLKNEYDYILIDSRTGLTDSSGICTIQMPDILITVFTANNQSLCGTRDVMKSVKKAQKNIAFDRGGLIIYPLLSRYEGNVEYEHARKWLDYSASELSEFFNEWLPEKSINCSEVIEKTKLPYIPYFSFGEELAVDKKGASDPAGLAYAYQVNANLIINKFRGKWLFDDNKEMEKFNVEGETLKKPLMKDRKIFISHVARDERIATALNKQLQSWSIPSELISQSSSYRNSNRIGHSINYEINAFLEEARLVILIYTYPDQYWDYCIFECGLAMNPKTPETNIIVFQCTNYLPSFFQDKLIVLANNLDGLRQFTTQFHKDSDFFPNLPAFDASITDENLEIFSKNLFNSIQDHLPKKEPKKSIRWGYFTLGVPANLVDLLQEAENIQDACDLCISSQGKIPVIDAAGFGLRHLGYQNFDSKLTFKKLIDCWYATITEELSEKFLSDENIAWIKELNFDICRSIRNESPRLSWIPLRSAFFGIDWQVCPVINEVQYAHDGSAALRVYMYRMDKTKIIEENISERMLFNNK